MAWCRVPYLDLQYLRLLFADRYDIKATLLQRGNDAPYIRAVVLPKPVLVGVGRRLRGRKVRL